MQIQLHLSNDILRDIGKHSREKYVRNRYLDIFMVKILTLQKFARQMLFGLHSGEANYVEFCFTLFENITIELHALESSAQTKTFSSFYLHPLIQYCKTTFFVVCKSLHWRLFVKLFIQKKGSKVL